MARSTLSESNYGGFILTFEPARTTRVIEALVSHGKAAESFSAEDWKFEKTEIIFLARRKPRVQIVGAALMRRVGGSGGTRRIKMGLSEPILFTRPIGADEARNGERLVDSISSAENLIRLSPTVWQALIETVLILRPEISEPMRQLCARRVEDRRILTFGPKSDRLLEQRDCVGLLLDIAGVDRRPILRSLRPKKVDSAKTILDILDAQPLAERTLVEQDSRLFGTELQDLPSADFSNERGLGVRVYVVDSTPIETATGVDLLIYQSKYNSFLMLQYKAMEFDAAMKNWGYRVDGSNVVQQLGTIAKLRAVLPKSSTLNCTQDQRLNPDPFYFKFCERTRLGSREEGLCAGFTVSALHLSEFLQMSATSSDGLSRRLGYKNPSRHFSNSEFVGLARAGWIGSQASTTSVIAKIVAAREQGRSAIIAVIERCMESPDARLS